jgi:hypothetical protein
MLAWYSKGSPNLQDAVEGLHHFKGFKLGEQLVMPKQAPEPQ